MTRYFTKKGDEKWQESTKEDYVMLEKFLGIHPGGHNEPSSTFFSDPEKGFSGKVTITKDPAKDELDVILDNFLNAGKL